MAAHGGATPREGVSYRHGMPEGLISKEEWRAGQSAEQKAWVDSMEDRWRQGLPLRGPRGEEMSEAMLDELLTLAGPCAAWGEETEGESEATQAASSHQLCLLPGQREVIPKTGQLNPMDGLVDAAGRQFGVDEVSGAITMVCPEGAVAGSLLTLSLRGGTSRQVVIPDGICPGQTFSLTAEEADAAVTRYHRVCNVNAAIRMQDAVAAAGGGGGSGVGSGAQQQQQRQPQLEDAGHLVRGGTAERLRRRLQLKKQQQEQQQQRHDATSREGESVRSAHAEDATRLTLEQLEAEEAALAAAAAKKKKKRERQKARKKALKEAATEAAEAAGGAEAEPEPGPQAAASGEGLLLDPELEVTL